MSRFSMQDLSLGEVYDTLNFTYIISTFRSIATSVIVNI